MTAFVPGLLAVLVNGWIAGSTLLLLAVALDRPRLLSARARHLVLLGCIGTSALLAVRAREWWAGGVLAAAGGGTIPSGEITLESTSPVAHWLAAVWLVVAVGLLVREGVGHRRLGRLRSTWRPAGRAERVAAGWRGDPRVRLLTGAGGAPLTLGLRWPAVYLPERSFRELTAAGLRAVAAHELAHARWRDPASWALARLIRIVLWPVAPFWVLERRLHRAAEEAADAAAIGNAGPAARTAYGHTLVCVARWSATAPALRRVPAVTGGSLEARLRAILRPPRQARRSALVAGALGVAAVVVLVALPWASPEPERVASGSAVLEPAEVDSLLDRFRQAGVAVSRQGSDRIRIVIPNDPEIRYTVRSIVRGDERSQPPPPDP